MPTCQDVASETGYSLLHLGLGTAAGLGAYFGVQQLLGMKGIPQQLKQIGMVYWGPGAIATVTALTAKAVTDHTRDKKAPVSTADRELQEAREKAEQAEQARATLETERDQLVAKREELEKQLAANPDAQKLAEAKDEAKQATEAKTAAEEQLDLVKAELQTKTDELAEANQKADQANERVEELEENVERLEAELKEAQKQAPASGNAAEVDELKRKLEETERQLEEAKKVQPSANGEDAERVKELEDELADLEEELERTVEAVNTAKQEVAEWKADHLALVKLLGGNIRDLRGKEHVKAWREKAQMPNVSAWGALKGKDVSDVGVDVDALAKLVGCETEELAATLESLVPEGDTLINVVQTLEEKAESIAKKLDELEAAQGNDGVGQDDSEVAKELAEIRKLVNPEEGKTLVKAVEDIIAGMEEALETSQAQGEEIGRQKGELADLRDQLGGKVADLREQLELGGENQENKSLLEMIIHLRELYDKLQKAVEELEGK